MSANHGDLPNQRYESSNRYNPRIGSSNRGRARGIGYYNTTPRGRGAGYQSSIPHRSFNSDTVTARDRPATAHSHLQQSRDQFSATRLSFVMLETISKYPAEIRVVEEVFSSLKGFQQSLNTCNSLKSDSQKNQYVDIVLTIISKVSKLMENESSMKILGEFLSERCEQFHMLLAEYVIKLTDDCFSSEVKIEKLCSVFETLLNRLPTSSWTVLPIDDLYEASKSVLLSSNLMDSVSHLKKQRNEIKECFKQQRLKASKQNSKNPEADFDNWDDSLFRSVEILPSFNEVCINSSPLLRPSLIQESYKGWDHYYDVQFRLLREDFVAPLRRGIQNFLKNTEGKNHDINLYKDVQVIEPAFTRQGMCFKIYFDNSGFRRSWEHSKRLMYGSLLCLSSDKFEEEIFFGTVLERKVEDLDNGFFVARFDDHQCMFEHQSKKTHFLMAESRAYFEAARHILSSLQTAEVETMPFSDYLLNSKGFSFVKPPSYLTNNPSRSKYDIKWIYSGSKESEYVNVLEDSDWPQACDVELDQSQLDAIKMALTQEIAVIQGPPGTGKTYIGYKIVQTLLENRRVWDSNKTSPILVMCLSNHALDQFLEGLLDSRITCHDRDSDRKFRQPDIVRVGGRSKNERIQELNISKIRNWIPRDLLEERREINEEIDECAKHMIWKSLEKSFKYPVNEYIVGPEGMKRLERSINKAHFEQLKLFVKNEKIALPWALELWLDLWEKSSEKSKKERPVALETKPIVTAETETKNTKSIETVTVEGEGELESKERMLEDDQSRVVIRRSNKEENEILQRKHRKIDHPKELFGKERKPGQVVWKILKEIQRDFPLREEEEAKIDDIRKLPIPRRRRLFRLWISKYQQKLVEDNEKKIKKYNELCEKATETQKQIDRYALEGAEVIGMTTTGAAKYQHIIHLVKPKIVIVEEAAELLESHIVSALNAGTQHLILIGDHKQLRPKPNEYDLAKKHNLHISLFERLILNGLSHAALMIQHRMRPQIASLVCPHIYDKLENHESVLKRDDIKGFDKNLFFFHHEHEEEENENLLSHSNSHEAEMVKSLCLHLINQGYAPTQITILTAYSGQLLKVKKIMPKTDFEGVRIVNIDNFQGEENDIIILSLVRNNSFKSVGFLKEPNRVCVALSRARLGFYCFGNFKMLRSAVPIWESILLDVESNECLGESFSLHCHNHPNIQYTVTQPNEFRQFAPEGGCIEKCLTRLNCDHVCTRLCHPDDPMHEQFKCLKHCEKPCPGGHQSCSLFCHEECKPCSVKVTKTISKCEHEQEMFCYEDPDTYPCQIPCPKYCPEGQHPCKLLFHQPCEPCEVKVVRILPKCQHKQEMFCYEDEKKFKCELPCEKYCSNSIHRCPLKCYQICRPCVVTVKRTMPECDHKQKMKCCVSVHEHKCQIEVSKIIKGCLHENTVKCSTDLDSHSCTSPCEKPLECGHQCMNMCGKDCTYFCEESVTIELECGHEEEVTCDEKRMFSLDYGEPVTCTSPCERILPACKHKCKKECGEACSSDDCQELTKQKLSCGHMKLAECREFQNFFLQSSLVCKEPCNKTFKSCGHPCPKKCHEKCPKKCSKAIQSKCPKGHSFSRQCSEPVRPCAKKCKEVLTKCNHKCLKTCGESCEPCAYILPSRECNCGHTHPKTCGDQSICSCTAKCTHTLKCGHVCSGVCGKCYSDRVHHPCEKKVSFTSFCGHRVTTSCFGMQYKCHENCLVSLCPHNRNKCEHKCHTDCRYSCDKSCPVSCAHVKCIQQCHQFCSVKPCKERCEKLLPCRHYCPGLCGEKCPLTCMTCSPRKFKDRATGLGKKTPPINHQYIQLDCGHLFTVRYLDEWLYGRPREGKLVTLPQCPTCYQPMTNVKRYWSLTKQRVNDIQSVKAKGSANVLTSYFDEVLDIVVVLNTDIWKIRKMRRTLTSTAEGACLTNMLYFFDQLGDPKNVKLILDIIMNFNGRMSEHLFSDLASELYRVHLLSSVTSLETIAAEITQPKKAFGSAKELLKQMDGDHNLRLSEDKYLSCLDGLKRLDPRNSMMLRMEFDLTKPLVTKGEWYKCSRGHLYFVSVGNRKQKHCSVCN